MWERCGQGNLCRRGYGGQVLLKYELLADLDCLRFVQDNADEGKGYALDKIVGGRVLFR
jgi:hypothetical protein